MRTAYNRAIYAVNVSAEKTVWRNAFQLSSRHAGQALSINSIRLALRSTETRRAEAVAVALLSRGTVMKLNCQCGQSYVYDHTKAGQAYTCTWCKQVFPIPAFQSLSHEDQTTYRKELEKQQKKQQQQAEKEAAKIQRKKERVERDQSQPAASVAPPVLAHQNQSATIKLSPHIRKVLFNADIIYLARPATAVLVIKLIICGILLSPVVLSLLLGFMVRGVPGPIEVAFLLPTLLCVCAWPTVIYFAWKNQLYVITRERTIVSRGIFNVAIRMILNRQIQMVSINTGLIDFFLGLNGVEIATSAQGGGSGIMSRFPGMTTGVTPTQVC